MINPSHSLIPLLAFASLVTLLVTAQGAPPTAAELPDAKNIKVYSSSELARSGWKVNKPPYPYKAMLAHEQGTVYVELTTDATGKIIHARTSKATKHPLLVAWSGTWVTANWHGPANVKVVTSLTYALR